MMDMKKRASIASAKRALSYYMNRKFFPYLIRWPFLPFALWRCDGFVGFRFKKI